MPPHNLLCERECWERERNSFTSLFLAWSTSFSCFITKQRKSTCPTLHNFDISTVLTWQLLAWLLIYIKKKKKKKQKRKKELPLTSRQEKIKLPWRFTEAEQTFRSTFIKNRRESLSISSKATCNDHTCTAFLPISALLGLVLSADFNKGRPENVFWCPRRTLGVQPVTSAFMAVHSKPWLVSSWRHWAAPHFGYLSHEPMNARSRKPAIKKKNHNPKRHDATPSMTDSFTTSTNSSKKKKKKKKTNKQTNVAILFHFHR